MESEKNKSKNVLDALDKLKIHMETLENIFKDFKGLEGKEKEENTKTS